MIKINYLLLSASILLGACNTQTSQKVENTMDTVGQKIENAVDTVKANFQENRDEDFVQDVIKANTKELHLLALAQKKGTNKEVKSHAKTMEADHKKMGSQMEEYAKKKNITVNIDSNDVKSDFDTDNAGADWDKKWVDKLVDEHQDVIDKFEKKEKNAKDEELKSMVSATLPTLHSHLDMMKQLQAKMQK